MRYVIYRDHIGWVITSLDDYELLVTVYRAMRANTWGEFMAALPDSERANILDKLADRLGPDFQDNPDDADEDPDDDLLTKETLFSSEDLPGFCEGDYPPWPANTREVSDEICETAYRRFGKRESGFIHTFHHVLDDRLNELKSWLESLGHELEVRQSPNA